jgi:hypothetical protein
MKSKTVCKILAVSIALAIVASGIVVNASSTSDISNCTSVNISYADVLTNDQNDRLQIQSIVKDVNNRTCDLINPQINVDRGK